MAIRQGNREQIQMLPACIEEYVPEDAPVRVYDAFVDSLDFVGLGIECDPGKEGNPSYDARAMLKLLVYGYSYGTRSSRRLEREVNYNLSFIWLMGGLKPDFKTIAEFRRKNKEALKKVLGQCARLCIKLDLIAGNILFVDGSKIRANASIKNSWSEKKCERVLSEIDDKIVELLFEVEAIDEAEDGQPSMVKLKEELQDAESRRELVTKIMEELRGQERASLNTVDVDCYLVHGRQGSHAGFNAQVVVDDKNGLIVSSDVATTNNDIGQFSSQIEKANAEMGKKCSTGVADSGYADVEDLGKTVEEQIQVIVPTQTIASKTGIPEFDKRSFAFDPDENIYLCPQGHALVRGGRTRRDDGYRYRITSKTLCLTCPHYGKCTHAKRGRTIVRRDDEILRESLEKDYALSENRAIYKRRQEKVELVFGHIKRNLGVTSFLLRGFEGARAEWSLLSLCFNLGRMMTLLGIKGLIESIRGRARAFTSSLLTKNATSTACARSATLASSFTTPSFA
jgi:transposase